MPLYEYKCAKCDHVFEVIQKFSDEPLAVHDGCGGAVERLLSSPALQFKGSGWYITDYAKGKSPSGEKKNNGTGDKAKSDSSSTSSSTPASSSSSDSKSSS